MTFFHLQHIFENPFLLHGTLFKVYRRQTSRSSARYETKKGDQIREKFCPVGVVHLELRALSQASLHLYRPPKMVINSCPAEPKNILFRKQCRPKSSGFRICTTFHTAPESTILIEITKFKLMGNVPYNLIKLDTLENSVDSYQLVSNQDLHCYPCGLGVHYIN